MQLGGVAICFVLHPTFKHSAFSHWEAVHTDIAPFNSTQGGAAKFWVQIFLTGFAGNWYLGWTKRYIIRGRPLTVKIIRAAMKKIQRKGLRKRKKTFAQRIWDANGYLIWGIIQNVGHSCKDVGSHSIYLRCAISLGTFIWKVSQILGTTSLSQMINRRPHILMSTSGTPSKPSQNIFVFVEMISL